MFPPIITTTNTTITTTTPGCYIDSVPGAPTDVSGSDYEDGQVTVSWTAPADDGGADITLYTVTESVFNSTTGVVCPVPVDCEMSEFSDWSPATQRVVLVTWRGHGMS